MVAILRWLAIQRHRNQPAKQDHAEFANPANFNHPIPYFGTWIAIQILQLLGG
jgi:hypothetical protein